MLRSNVPYSDAAMDQPSTSSSNQSNGSLDEMHKLYVTLGEYLALEDKFQPRICLPEVDQEGEVTIGARDGAAQILRSLKVWFDLPSQVLIHAINLLDRFLTKMKVRPCHVPCITIACMDIAIDERAKETGQPRAVSLSDLVSISQASCTAGDAARMSAVVQGKLSTGCTPAVTAFHWLRLFAALMRCAEGALGLPDYFHDGEMTNLLEIAMCDYACANARPSELALVLVMSRLGELPAAPSRLLDYGAELQTSCQMSSSLPSLHAALLQARSRYSARAAVGRRKLRWNLSRRTRKVLRPTSRLSRFLPTIEEQIRHTPSTK